MQEKLTPGLADPHGELGPALLFRDHDGPLGVDRGGIEQSLGHHVRHDVEAAVELRAVGIGQI